MKEAILKALNDRMSELYQKHEEAVKGGDDNLVSEINLCYAELEDFEDIIQNVKPIEK